MWRLGLVLAFATTCTSKKDAGETCDYSSDCKSQVCFARHCQTGTLGGLCEYDYQCTGDGISCYRSECRAKAGVGGKCDNQTDCASTTTCLDRVCRDSAGVRAHETEVAAAAREAQADKEARMLAESGVSNAAPTAEIAAHPPGAGVRVRTAKVTAKDSAFAACRSNERLIGGGCQSTVPVAGNYPSGQNAEDTVGARWNCTGGQDHEVTAYALCSKVP